jgi:prophage antirepressor-like protein
MDIMKFSFDNQPVRVITIDNKLWYIAKEVAAILGYSETAMMTRRLDDDEVGKIASAELADSNSMAREYTVINESGLYSAIIGSNKPNAKVFKKWVTSEVIPSIMKTGSFSVNKTPQLLSVEVIKSLLCQYDAEQTRADELQMLNSAITPAANYTAEVLMSQDLITINIIAAELHISNIALYAFLKEKEIIYKQGGIWHPGSYWRCYELFGYHTHRYFDGKGEPHATEYLKATQRGRKFILALYNNENPEKSAKVIYRETFEPLKLAMGV